MLLQARGDDGHAQLHGRGMAVARVRLVSTRHNRRDGLHDTLLRVAVAAQQQHAVVAAARGCAVEAAAVIA